MIHMICLILAAGYATRLYPVTRKVPKPLLLVGDKHILDYLVEDMDNIKEISEYVIVTNHIFAEQFEEWARFLKTDKKITVLDDGTITNETRMGAVKDIQFTIEKLNIKDDLLVMAGDNLLDFSLKYFVAEFYKRKKTLVMCSREENLEKLKRTGVAKLGEKGIIVSMEEKPENPKSRWAIPPFYVFMKKDLSHIMRAAKAGCRTDSPGELLVWLCGQTEVFAMEMPGNRFDIGNLNSYRKAQKRWKTSKSILITGGAGFIGAALSLSLLKDGIRVIGYDNLNEYYDIKLKEARLKELYPYKNYTFIKGDLTDQEELENIFEIFCPDVVVHLGAQAGVRYSVENPKAYIDSNIIGFFHVLEACRHSKEPDRISVQHLVFASSSSVYGLQEKVPYSTEDRADHPVSLYAATKRSNELMAHAYSKLYQFPCTGLRFFTVYGPKGRPDMAYYSFTEKMRMGEKIALYNNGNMLRDFTYIDDIITGIRKLLDIQPTINDSGAKYKVYNIGNSKPETLEYFIHTLERILIEEKIVNAPVEKEYLPMQPGDVYQTYADVGELEEMIQFSPSTNLDEGLHKFAVWYKEYYKLEENGITEK